MMLTVARAARLIAAVAAAGAFAPFAHAQGSFEGVVTATMTGKDGATPVTITNKGDKSRMDMTAPAGRGPGGPMSMIMDAEKHRSYMVMHSQKAYFETKAMDMDSVRRSKPPKEFAKTGTTETIAGIRCEDYRFVDQKGREATVCAASGMGSWNFGMGGGRRPGGNTPDWAQELIRKGFFLLKINSTNEEGSPFSLEVTKVDRKSVPDSEFQPPADYKSMGGMGMGGRPPRG